MKQATFYLEAWRIAKAINQPLSSIVKTSFTEYVILEAGEKREAVLAAGWERRGELPWQTPLAQ